MSVFIFLQPFRSYETLAFFIYYFASFSLYGVVQWIVLRWYHGNIGRWVIAVITGLFLAGFTAFIPLYKIIPLYTWLPGNINTIINNSAAYFLYGAVAGVVVSIPQWLVLRHHVSKSGWWIMAVTIGWGISWVTMNMSQGAFLHELNFGITYGLVTGGVLIWLLHQPPKDVPLEEPKAKS
ncbi:MAG: hypothetical protein N2C13_04580 [Chloroflexota bacterium]